MKKTIMVRKGECSMCGNCCRTLKFDLGTGKITRNSREFFKARGIKIRISKYTGKSFMLIPHACPQLVGDICKLHPKKPRDCRLQPVTPQSHEGLGCSYRWVKKEVKESTTS